MSSFFLFSSLLGGVVVVAALAAHDAQRAANRAVRWVWFGAIFVMVALSLVAPFRRVASPMRITIPGSVNGVDVSVPRDAPRGMLARWARSRDAIVIPIDAALQTAQSSLARVPAPLQRGLAVSWLLASLVTVGVFGVSYLRISRQMNTWPSRRIDNVLARIAPAAGPAVVGLAPSEIILPAWLLARPAHEQRLVVAHESEHVRAGDPWLLVIACGAVACMPWNPALWFALGRLRLAVELDCDRRVLRRGIPKAAYGSLLIELSALRSTFPSAMPAFSCNGSYLERRLVAMTSRPSRFVHARRIGSGLFAVVALVTACESKLPTSADVDRMDVAAAEAQAKRIVLVDSGRTRYVVDGKTVSEVVAKGISANRIAGVHVVKGTGNELSEIRIATQDTTFPTSRLDSVRSPGPLTPREVKGFGLSAVSPARKFDGLLLVDGRIVDASELERIDPSQIGSVEVVKGAAAARAFTDPRAVNGVIKVTMKAKP